MNGDRAVLETSGMNLKEAGFAIDENRRCVLMDGKTIGLMPLEFLLMLAFVRHPNTVLSRNQLLREVWGTDFLGKSRTVDVHVSFLRKKLKWESQLVTIHRAGYRLELY
jgi:DNA-binding response OmpR family regulator